MAKFEQSDPRWIVAERTDGKNVNAWHWEEKSMVKWAEQRLRELVKDKVVHEASDAKVVLTKLDKLEGDVDLHQRKGRKFFTFEVATSASWSAQITESGETRTGGGTINLPDASSSDKDWPSSVSVTEGDKSMRPRFELLAKVYAVSGFKSAVQALIDELDEMTKQSEEQIGATAAASDAAAAARVTAAAAAAAVQKGTGVKLESLAKQAAGVQTKTIKLEEVFNCSPSDLYACFVEPPRIAAYTQAPARVEKSDGGVFEMLGGSITGTFVELKEAERIVQRWRMKDWPADHESMVTLAFATVADGTRLSLTQTGVPVDEVSRTEYGWRIQFFKRIKMVFGYGA